MLSSVSARDEQAAAGLPLRVHMQRISMEDQETVVGYLLKLCGKRLKTVRIDKTGLGFTLWERLARKHAEDRIKGCNFSANYAVAMEDR